MMPYTPSYAIDALSSGNAPGVTIYPKLATGSPETILKHVTDLLTKAQQFMTLIDEFKKAEKQLGDAWSGHAAESAVKKIEDSLSAFSQIVQVIQRGAGLLEGSATLLTTAQTGYTSVVGAVNPTVASLMSNPYTYPAAQALATVTAASLSAFVNAISGLLKALGAVKIAGELATLGQIVMLIEQLFNSKGAGAPVNSGAVTGSTVTAPKAPDAAASATGASAITAAGQQAATAAQQTATATAAQSGAQLGHSLTGLESTLDQNGQLLDPANSAGQPTAAGYQNYTPSALAGLPNSAAAAGTIAAGTPVTGGAAGTGTDSWVPVDPTSSAATGATPPIAGTDTSTATPPIASTTPGSAPTDPGSAPAGSTTPAAADEIRVTTVHGDTTTTVEVPLHSGEEVVVSADGTVTIDADQSGGKAT